jgi:hypothetical protein
MSALRSALARLLTTRLFRSRRSKQPDASIYPMF